MACHKYKRRIKDPIRDSVRSNVWPYPRKIRRCVACETECIETTAYNCYSRQTKDFSINRIASQSKGTHLCDDCAPLYRTQILLYNFSSLNGRYRVYDPDMDLNTIFIEASKISHRALKAVKEVLKDYLYIDNTSIIISYPGGKYGRI